MSSSAGGSYHSQFAGNEEDISRHEEKVFSQSNSSSGMIQRPSSLANSINVHGMGIAGLPTMMDQNNFDSLPPNWADSIPVDMQAQWLQLQQQQQQHQQQLQRQQQAQYNIPQGFSHPHNEAGSSTSRNTSSSYSNPQDSPEMFVGGQHSFASPSQASPFQDASFQHIFSSPSQQQQQHQRTQSPHHSQHSFIHPQTQHAHHPFPQNSQQHLARNTTDSPLMQDPSADLAFLQAATGMQQQPYSTQNVSWQQQPQSSSRNNGIIANGNQSYPIMTSDFTDRALSAALASNAQISSNRNMSGSGVNVSPMTSSNASSFPQNAGNTTPTILEEDEASFHPHPQHHHHNIGQNDPQFFNSPDHLITSQSYNHPEAYTGHHHSHAPMPSALMQPRRTGSNLLRASTYQQYSNINVGMMEERFRDSKEDCLPFIDDVIFNYISAPSRLGLGERTVMIMTSKVAQKSYGAEKRFLCPPPMVLLVGSSWWSACHPVSTTSDEAQPTILTPPRLAISMSGDTPNQAGGSGVSSSQQDGVLEWASSSGKLLDTDNPSSEFAISGRSIGRQLFINDSDEKRRHCEALVQIQVPALAASDRKSLGIFPSKPIKVISKPSKKRQSTRNSELGVNHGSTISLFHRLRSQTVSTRYLCVSGAPTWFKGSDGNPFLNTDANTHIPNQGDSPSCFVAKTSSWDPFILYLVDPHMQAGANPTTNTTHNPSVEQKFTPSAAYMQSGNRGDGNDSGSSANLSSNSGMSSNGPGSSGANTQGRPAHYPIPPVNALPFQQGNIPIHYNQPIVLQCLNTAVVSPVMVIRKADRGTTVVGGGQPLLSFGSNGPPPGEMYGEPVSQLHKVAFEILEEQPDGGESIQAGNPGFSGHFLGCLNEDVGLRKPLGPRQWMQTSSASTSVAQSGMHINPLLSNNGAGQSGNISNPATPTTPLTPMTTQMFASTGNHAGMHPNNISGEFKMDPSISPTGFMLYGSGNSGHQQMIGSSSQLGMGGMSNPPTTYPYNMNPQTMPNAVTDDQGDNGKVKRPRRVSSSVLVPQKSGGSSVAVSTANKNRRRGQSLSVIGLQNQLNAQQQQQQQQQHQQRNQTQHPSQQTPSHHMTHSMHQQRPSFTASTTNTSSSSSSISSMTGIASGQSLRRTSSFAQSDTSSLSAAAMNSVASNPNTTMNHWTVDVHDSDVWTIVGVDIARHTFYLPPKLVNGTRPKADGVDASIAHLVTMPAPAHPITPIPILHKCSGGANGLSSSLSNSALALAASQKSVNGIYASEANLVGTPDSPLRPASASSSAGGGGGAGQGAASGYVTLIGENFTPNLFIFFGDWHSTHISVPNSNTIICAAPPALDEFGIARDHVPIILVRRDGVIFPTDCIWYKAL